MKRISANALDYLAPAAPEQPTINAETLQNVANWHNTLRQIYAMKELNEAGVMAWAGVLGECDNKIMLSVIKDWIKYEDKAPKPANLLAAYRSKTGQNRQRKKTQKFIAGEETYACKYCHDTGYFRKFDYDGTEVMYPCRCDSRDLSGNLYKALHSEWFVWDDERHGFIPRREWVGDARD